MKPGKISENVLKRSVLKYTEHGNSEIARGAGIGNDCALFAFCQGAATGSCSLSIGPKEKVRHAIFAAVNNLSAGGQKAKYLLLHLTLPERDREIRIREAMEEATRLCRRNGWQIIGGHTEVSVNVTEMIINVTALSASEEEDGGGKMSCAKENLTGYDVVVSGYIGMEAAGLIAEKKAEELEARFPKWLLEECNTYQEHVSVEKAAELAQKHGARQMHDVGEGGIFASLWEMAQKAGTGLAVSLKQIPMKQAVVEICNYYDLNPYEIWSQGCLLMAVKDGEVLVQDLLEADIPAAVIGKMTDGNDRIIENGEEIRYMDLPKPDQIRKLL